MTIQMVTTGRSEAADTQPLDTASGPSSTQNSTLKTHNFSLQLPREGLCWLAIALALLCIGLVKGINLLLLLACLMAALWGLNAILAGRRLGWLQGQRSFEGPVFAQTPFVTRWQVANPRPEAVLEVRVEDPTAGQPLSWFVPRLGEQESISFQEMLALPERGRHAWGPLLATSGYPFGLVRRRRPLTPGEEIIV